jgi:hypothetical protein
MTDTAELILMVLHNNERSVRWLADKLHVNTDSLYYLLHDAKRFPIETYRGICKVFEREGLEYMHTIVSDRHMRDHALSIGSVANEMLGKMHKTVLRMDDVSNMSIEDKRAVMESLRALVDGVRAEADKLAEALGGKL